MAAENRCLLCGTDLGLDWPNLTELDPSNIKNREPDEWRQAAAAGCPFCNIVIAVINDAGKQHGCSVPDGYELLRTGSPAGNDIKGFQVILSRNESTGRYLLALEYIWMPVLVEPKHPGWEEFWGTITVYLDEPDVFHLNLEPFQEIPKHSDSVEALKYARDWLTTCQNNHPGCSLAPNRGCSLNEVSAASIRILQICDEKLILMPMKLCGTLPPYVALSHCWGSSPTLKTLSTNIDGFLVGISVQDLPSTFKDAVKMTKLLGFDYIWIDSLCIVQDSLTDWEEQSSLMASVYGNADLVLAASSALSTEGGFPKERGGYQESSLNISCVQNKESNLALRYRLLQSKDLAPLVEPLDWRAWALQERLLARRYLAIGSQDTTWTCTTSLACECEWWRVASICRNEITNTERVLRDTRDEDVAQCWREKVLEHYSYRGLTVPSDNLVAVSAIASVFHERSRQEYYAGIWQGDLIHGLLWSSGYYSYAAYATDNSAPSWSWASLPFLFFRPHSDCSTLSENEPLVRVLEIKTTKSTMNPFGSVHAGFVKLWGQVWTAEATASELVKPFPTEKSILMKVNGYIENTFIFLFDMSMIMVDICLPDGAKETTMRRVRREEVQDRFYIGNLRDRKTVHLIMVPFLEEDTEVQGSKLTRTHGLVLSKSCTHPTKFERLGTFFIENFNPIDSRVRSENNEDVLGEQEIVII